MLLPVLYYAGAALGGWVAGNAVLDTVNSSTGKAVQAAVPTVIETGFPFSPFMVLSMAVAAIAVAFAVRSIGNTIRSWQSDPREDRYYH